MHISFIETLELLWYTTIDDTIWQHDNSRFPPFMIKVYATIRPTKNS